MGDMVYENKVDTGDEIIQRIFEAARRVNDTEALRKVTLLIFERVRISSKLMAAIFPFIKLNCTTFSPKYI
jgi:hypothetical protein